MDARFVHGGGNSAAVSVGLAMRYGPKQGGGDMLPACFGLFVRVYMRRLPGVIKQRDARALAGCGYWPAAKRWLTAVQLTTFHQALR